jgi:rhomboid family GlyGly-CTERM serine protease
MRIPTVNASAMPAPHARLSSFPWATSIAALAAAGVFFAGERASLALRYERAGIFEGELWRVVSGHWVHFTATHLLWNLVVVLATGLWLERRDSRSARRVLLLAPVAISVALLIGEPSLAWYGGLSGVASALLIALVVDGWKREPHARRWWLSVLLLFLAKVAFELWQARPLFTDLDGHAIRVVPLAHAAGAAAGFLLSWWRKI